MQYAIVITAEAHGKRGTIRLRTNTRELELHSLLNEGSTAYGRNLKLYVEKIWNKKVEGLTLEGASDFDSDALYTIISRCDKTDWSQEAAAQITA